MNDMDRVNKLQPDTSLSGIEASLAFIILQQIMMILDGNTVQLYFTVPFSLKLLT